MYYMLQFSITNVYSNNQQEGQFTVYSEASATLGFI